MDEQWIRLLENLAARVDGPLSGRLLLQPLMACTFAILAGLRDAREGRKPYLWGMLSSPGDRAGLVKDGWKSVGKVFLIALVLDVVYQVIVQRFVYPGEALIVALVLAIIPYLLVRPLTTRLVGMRR